MRGRRMLHSRPRRPMTVTRTLPFALAVIAGSMLVSARQVVPGATEKHDHFSPLAFDELKAYEEASPAQVGSVPVQFATANKYWAFQGVAYQGAQAQGAVWTSLGPITGLYQPSNPGQNFSGRVSALAIDPNCTVSGSCRLWVGTAGGGVWRSEDAMNTTNIGWHWIGTGLQTNSIGSLTVDPNDPTDNTVYVGTGETNTPQNSGAGTGLYVSTNAGDQWTRVSTMIVDPVVQSTPIDFTLTRGI